MLTVSASNALVRLLVTTMFIASVVSVAAYMVSPLAARLTMSTPVGPRTWSSVLGMLASLPQASVAPDAGTATTIILASNDMARPTPNILVNLLLIDL